MFIFGESLQSLTQSDKHQRQSILQWKLTGFMIKYEKAPNLANKFLVSFP